MFATSCKTAKGTWYYREPNWETRLEELGSYELEKTGLSREKLHQVLEILAENGVISNN